MKITMKINEPHYYKYYFNNLYNRFAVYERPKEHWFYDYNLQGYWVNCIWDKDNLWVWVPEKNNKKNNKNNNYYDCDEEEDSLYYDILGYRCMRDAESIFDKNFDKSYNIDWAWDDTYEGWWMECAPKHPKKNIQKHYVWIQDEIYLW